jgi:hypothetical protein
MLTHMRGLSSWEHVVGPECVTSRHPPCLAAGTDEHTPRAVLVVVQHPRRPRLAVAAPHHKVNQV